MSKKGSSQFGKEAQGVALIELVIARVQTNPRCLAGLCNDYPLLEPYPLSEEAIAALRFPNGQALPPSLKRWLAFDAAWLTSLGWFRPQAPTLFTPRNLDKIIQDEFGDFFWGPAFKSTEAYVLPGTPEEIALDETFEPTEERFSTCFLLPEGNDSRRIYTVSAPDPLGECPVLVADMDDTPYLGLMYPGFDVSMADLTGVIDLPWGTYTDLFDDPRYAERMQWHADTLFHGKRDNDYDDEE